LYFCTDWHVTRIESISILLARSRPGYRRHPQQGIRRGPRLELTPKAPIVHASTGAHRTSCPDPVDRECEAARSPAARGPSPRRLAVRRGIREGQSGSRQPDACCPVLRTFARDSGGVGTGGGGKRPRGVESEGEGGWAGTRGAGTGRPFRGPRCRTLFVIGGISNALASLCARRLMDNSKGRFIELVSLQG
jgi:hypothetical protein